ncbi:hypothetical protein [Campylobacter jejuni]|uniref:hypothetical protein n=1 Tax=Campylobacter jejuni TaxID=197 RepID=UPI000ACB2FD5|nr:hypothetical protein [Campylobacter jejuni]
MSNLIFKNENFGAVRVAYENNEPLFCLSYVCKNLELTNHSIVELNKLNLYIFDSGYSI